jgi:DNA-binding Lrp family transcriptional regulator
LTACGHQAKLEASGVIAGYTIKTPGIPLPTQTSHVFLKLERGATCVAVGPKIKRIRGVAAVYSVAGDGDLIVRLEAGTMNDIETARAAISAVTGVHVTATVVTLKVL